MMDESDAALATMAYAWQDIERDCREPLAAAFRIEARAEEMWDGTTRTHYAVLFDVTDDAAREAADALEGWPSQLEPSHREARAFVNHDDRRPHA